MFIAKAFNFRPPPPKLSVASSPSLYYSEALQGLISPEARLLICCVNFTIDYQA